MPPFTLEKPTSTYTHQIRSLLRETRSNDGLAPIDLEKFWNDQELSIRDPFNPMIPQLPLGIRMNPECIFDELGIEEDFWRLENDLTWAAEVKKAYNDKAERIVGKRLLDECIVEPSMRFPKTKGLHDVFEARNTWHSGSWWLEQSAHDEDELKALLDRVEQRNIRAFILPDNWNQEKTRLMALGCKLKPYRWQRGPVTFATSIYGIENLIFLLLDNPDLGIRFRDLICRTMLEIARVIDAECGYTPETAPRGFGFADDNCCMLNPEMYELFGFPVLKAVFDRYSPNPADMRFQHSDSAMAQHLPALSDLNMTGVNFGPKLTVREIREFCPRAIIYGQLAPFTFSRNEEEKMLLELVRDFEQSRPMRGVVFDTAGSINNGSRLTGMRLIMAGIQRICRQV
jgi:uroporphyrinogen decarboxylase